MSLLKKDFAIKTEQEFEENLEIHKHVLVFSLEKRQIKMAYNGTFGLDVEFVKIL